MPLTKNVAKNVSQKLSRRRRNANKPFRAFPRPAFGARERSFFVFCLIFLTFPMFSRKNIFRAAMSVLLFATSLFFASCKVPPSPPPTANGSVIPISYAIFSWKDVNDFKRISEYFTDRENTGFNCVLRTDPETREGLYLVLGIEVSEKIPDDSTATLRYFRPDKVGEQTATFRLPEFESSVPGEILFGLTGNAWPKELKKRRPSAWQLSVHAPDGTLLLYRQSYLWEREREK